MKKLFNQINDVLAYIVGIILILLIVIPVFMIGMVVKRCALITLNISALMMMAALLTLKLCFYLRMKPLTIKDMIERFK